MCTRVCMCVCEHWLLPSLESWIMWLVLFSQLPIYFLTTIDTCLQRAGRGGCHQLAASTPSSPGSLLGFRGRKAQVHSPDSPADKDLDKLRSAHLDSTAWDCNDNCEIRNFLGLLFMASRGGVGIFRGISGFRVQPHRWQKATWRQGQGLAGRRRETRSRTAAPSPGLLAEALCPEHPRAHLQPALRALPMIFQKADSQYWILLCSEQLLRLFATAELAHTPRCCMSEEKTPTTAWLLTHSLPNWTPFKR